MGECYICGEETDKGKKNFALGEWIYLCSRACDDEYDPYRAESFDAEGDSEAYVVWKLKGKLPDRDWEVIEVFNDREDAVNASKNYSYGVFEELIGMEEDDERGAEGFRDAESFEAHEYSYYHRKKAYKAWRKNYEASGILQDRKKWNKLYDSFDKYKSQGFSKGESMVKSMKEMGLYNQLMQGVNVDAFLDHYSAESFDADWDNAPYGSWDEAWSDEISFPMVEKPERLWLKNLSVIAVFAGAIWVGKQTRK